MIDKVKQQVDLEKESLALGIQRYEKETHNKDTSETPPGIALLNSAINPLVEAIEDFKKPTKGGGRLNHTRCFFNMFDSYTLAYITTQRCINCLSKREPVQFVAVQIVNMLLDNMEYQKFKQEAPGYLKKVESRLNTVNKKHRKVVIMRAKRKLEIEDEVFHEEDKISFGTKLIDLMISSTGLVIRRRVDSIKANNNKIMVLDGTTALHEWLHKQHAKCSLLSPVYLPMVIKPKDWTTPFDGGFITNEINMRHKIIRTRNKKALLQIADVEMPKVYKAINAIQDTAWSINKNVYDVMQELAKMPQGIAGLPPMEKESVPVAPWTNDAEFEELKETNPEVIKRWKLKAQKIYDRWYRNTTKRTGIMQKLWLADKFKDEDKIYFCWNMDWRGRFYPIQSLVNPQADDSGKALLQFAEGKPLGSTGLYWLKIHLANSWGEDKVTFEDTIKWVDNNVENIKSAAQEPLDYLWWADADDPFMFLAACFEYHAAMTSSDPKAYISHLPINMDGTCNGLQHFSAMLRDSIGGHAVNLINQDKPSDIYTEVAQKAAQKVARDASDGDEIAKLWVGKVSRKIVKRGVMTTPYGAKKYGLSEQLQKELRQIEEEQEGTPYLDLPEGITDYFKPSLYLSKVLWESISTTVIAARDAMDWLQNIAKEVGKLNEPITWTTPVGFKVYQDYPKQDKKMINTFWGGIRIRMSYKKDAKKGGMDKIRMTNGIAPNFVHSLDAAHLIETVCRLVDNNGIQSFCMIHDSYGTHACDVDILNKTLRESFVWLYYEYDVIKEFVKQLPDDIEIPDVPPKGTLDLEDVKSSRYFFA